jgi:DNA-binding protein HU-beta
VTNVAKALKKSQITASLAETVGITMKQATQTLEAIVALAYKNAKNTFTIPGLGKLVLVNRNYSGRLSSGA